jgi:putative Mg2+ transporter-C (MgtC) family protein
MVIELINSIPQDLSTLSIAALLGLLMGTERAIHHKNISVRTFALISLGSCLFAMLSILAAGGLNRDPTRIGSQIVSGIGFLGAGVIFKSQNKVEGITTAAMVWTCCSLGMACGFGYTRLAVHGIILYFLILWVGRLLHRVIDSKSIERE